MQNAVRHTTTTTACCVERPPEIFYLPQLLTAPSGTKFSARRGETLPKFPQNKSITPCHHHHHQYGGEKRKGHPTCPPLATTGAILTNSLSPPLNVTAPRAKEHPAIPKQEDGRVTKPANWSSMTKNQQWHWRKQNKPEPERK